MQVPAPFEYERATSVDHALDLLQRLAAHRHLIDIDDLAFEQFLTGKTT